MRSTLFILALALAQSAVATPLELTHQARLLDASGSPLQGRFTIQLDLYDAPIAGANVYSAEHSVQMDDGYLSLLMAPEDTALASDVWVQVTVDGEALEPRSKLGSVPYARIARSLSGGSVDATSIAVNGIPVVDSTGAWVGLPTGLVGPQGPAGADGLQGEPGPIGPQGQAGVAGSPGLDGPAGPQGQTGDTGLRGPTGPTGPQGEMGATGSRGPQGLRGAQGPIGPQGQTGPQGQAGATGSRGPAGPQGLTGPAGARGLTGPAGPQGLTGATGSRGPVGPQGPSGTSLYQRAIDGGSAVTLTGEGGKYHLITTYNASYRDTRRVPQSIIDNYCGDLDGCQVVIAMRNWWSGGLKTEPAGYDFHFWYTPSNGRWRRSDSLGNVTGDDGDGTTTHVINAFDACYFTDGNYSNGSNLNDSNRGMNLLYWTGYTNGSTSVKKQCELTIID